LYLSSPGSFVVEMALGGADPTLVGAHDGDGLALDEILDRVLDLGRRIGELGAAAAEGSLAAELALGLLDLVGDLAPLQLLVLQERLEVLALRRELLVLALDLELFQPAQRTQAHVEDGLGLQV
jgi:hypothetical protein